mmetsp:Transcript_17634/g.36086  ORF Transcript_17634/g.36086 Transcript_17634/m.36086 type:complete len:673 (+) Transcript_17634:33-2051(+)
MTAKRYSRYEWHRRLVPRSLRTANKNPSHLHGHTGTTMAPHPRSSKHLLLAGIALSTAAAFAPPSLSSSSSSSSSPSLHRSVSPPRISPLRHHVLPNTVGSRRTAATAAATSPKRRPSRLQSSSSDESASSSSSSSSTIDCLVVGGGISGATLAHNLFYGDDDGNGGGLDVLLTESRSYLGGNVQSTLHADADGSFLFENGPNSFATQPSVVRISHQLNIQDQLVFADESLPPWVNHHGKLHPLPKGKGGKGARGQLELLFGSNGILKFGLTGDLLSWPGKIRAAVGALAGHAPPPADGTEETIRDWVTRILGEEVFARIIDPFVSGVYAGDPSTLSMKAALPKIARIEEYSYDIEWNKFGAIFYGGLARQVELTKERKADPPKPEWVEFEYGNPGSYKNGLSTLPKAIEKELGDRVKLEWTLTRVSRIDPSRPSLGYLASFSTPTGPQTVRAKSVVSTLPAHAADSVFEPVLPASPALFSRVRDAVNRRGIYYPPVAAVTLAYPRSSFRDVDLPNDFGKLSSLPGFGLLHPRSEGIRTLGTLWSSSLFPGRCPDDYHILLNYIGGSRDPAIGTMKEEDIVRAVDEDLRKVLLKRDAKEPKVLGVKVWPTAIPQYELGHLEIMTELEEMEKTAEGLWICGNYRSGVAFPDCVTFGYEQAKVVREFLETRTKV